MIRHGTIDEDIQEKLKARFIQRKKHLIDSMHIFAENALVNEFKEVIMAVLQVEIIKMDVTHDVVAWQFPFPWCFLFNNRKYWLEKFGMFWKVFEVQ